MWRKGPSKDEEWCYRSDEPEISMILSYQKKYSDERHVYSLSSEISGMIIRRSKIKPKKISFLSRSRA